MNIEVSLGIDFLLSAYLIIGIWTFVCMVSIEIALFNKITLWKILIAISACILVWPIMPIVVLCVDNKDDIRNVYLLFIEVGLSGNYLSVTPINTESLGVVENNKGNISNDYRKA